MILESQKINNFNKFWTEFLLYRNYIQNIFHLKKPVKNYNNPNKQILTKLNKFSHFKSQVAHRNAKKKKTYKCKINKKQFNSTISSNPKIY